MRKAELQEEREQRLEEAKEAAKSREERYAKIEGSRWKKLSWRVVRVGDEELVIEDRRFVESRGSEELQVRGAWFALDRATGLYHRIGQKEHRTAGSWSVCERATSTRRSSGPPSSRIGTASTSAFHICSDGVWSESSTLVSNWKSRSF